jgi:aspartyl protease family protein
MLRYAVVAAVAALSAVGAAQTFVALDRRADEARARPPQAAAAVAQSAPTPTSNGAASITKSADGHYWALATVDGRAVRFLVDTGASAVALTAQDARRLGYDPATLTYSYPVETANGQAHAARITLPNVTIAGARIENVEAFVIDHGLETSLLGMTYLGRLSRFEATPTALILHP